MEITLQLLAVIIVLGGLALLSHRVRSTGGLSPARKRLTIEQRATLTNGCQLAVVRWDDQEFLITTGTQTCTVLGTHPAPASPPPVAVSLRKDLRACAG